MANILWKIHYLFYKYILRHRYTIGVDMGSQDGDCSVIVRTDRKGNKYIEKIT